MRQPIGIQHLFSGKLKFIYIPFCILYPLYPNSNFSKIQLISYYAIIMLADLIRVWYGPLSEPICNGLQLARHTIQVMGFLLWMVVAILKFWIVCIRKSLPTMDDDFVTTFVTIASFMLSLLYSLIAIILPQKPTLAHVCLTHCSNILN